MTHPVDPAVADGAADAFYQAMSRVIELSLGMYARQGAAGTRLLFTGTVETLNLVYAGREPDLGEVDAFAKELSDKNAPWSILLRGDADPALLDLAARYGKTSSVQLPVLVWDAELLPSLPTSVPEGATVREITGGEHDIYATALVNGFGWPKSLADNLSRPELLDSPHITSFVLDLDGEPVASGRNIVVGDWVSMLAGSVPPRHRRKGYYRALVSARLRHAVARGARYALSQNTPMSRPLFESLGFQQAETWTYLTSES
jgi:hypothetical protein